MYGLSTTRLVPDRDEINGLVRELVKKFPLCGGHLIVYCKADPEKGIAWEVGMNGYHDHHDNPARQERFSRVGTTLSEALHMVLAAKSNPGTHCNSECEAFRANPGVR